MKKILLFVLCLFLVSLSSCKKNNDQTLNLIDTPKQAQQCADELIEYLKPDTYAWSYVLMQGKLNLTVDFVCKIEIYYALDSETNYANYAEYICYIKDNDVDFEQFYYERIG
jgi:hypothetical protein